MSKGLKSLLQDHSSKALVLRSSAFFMVQPSHLYMTTGNIIALTIQTFVSKVMSVLLNMLSRFVIVFLPRRNCLLISWLQSLSTVILEPKKIKSERCEGLTVQVALGEAASASWLWTLRAWILERFQSRAAAP